MATRRLTQAQYSHGGEYFFHLDKCSLIHNIADHSHDFAELVVILAGTAVHVVEGTATPVNAGHVFVVEQDTVHGYRSVDRVEYFNIMFDQSRLALEDQLHQLAGFRALLQRLSQPLVLEPARLRRLEATLDGLHREFERRLPGFAAMIQLQLSTVFLELSRLVGAEPPSEPKTPVDHAQGQLEQVRDYLEGHFREPITVNQLAHLACLSVRQFQRSFRQAFATTPSDYLIRLRLEHARSLLATGTLRVGEAALASGFSDPNYFSRQYRKRYGMSPSQGDSYGIQSRAPKPSPSHFGSGAVADFSAE